MPGDLSPTTLQPSSSSLIRKGLYIGLALIAGTGVARLFEYVGEHPYPGALRSRVTLVSSNCLAQVREVSVKAGQTLSPGDSLVQLVDSKLEDRIISKRREIAELEAEMIRVKIAAEVDLAWRRRELETEVFETQLKETALTQERLNKQVEQLAWKDYLACADASISPIGAASDDPFRSLTKELQLPDERRLQSMLREDAAAASAETLSIQITLCQERLTRLAALEKNLEQKIRAGSGVDVIEAKLKGAQRELDALGRTIKRSDRQEPDLRNCRRCEGEYGRPNSWRRSVGRNPGRCATPCCCRGSTRDGSETAAWVQGDFDLPGKR